MQESEQRFRALFETMTEGVALHRLLLDEHGNPAAYVVTDANPAYETHTGLKREDAVGRRASDLYGADGLWLVSSGRGPVLVTSLDGRNLRVDEGLAARVLRYADF